MANSESPPGGSPPSLHLRGESSVIPSNIHPGAATSFLKFVAEQKDPVASEEEDEEDCFFPLERPQSALRCAKVFGSDISRQRRLNKLRA